MCDKTNNTEKIAGIQREIMLRLFDHIESQVKLADGKAALLFTLDAVLIKLHFDASSSIVGASSTYPLDFWLYVNISLLFFSLLVAMSAVVPVFRLNIVELFTWPARRFCKSRQQGSSPRLMFFRGIAEQDVNEYIVNFSVAEPAELEVKILQEIHGKSTWLRGKFVLVRVAMFATAIVIFSSYFLIVNNWGRLQNDSAMDNHEVAANKSLLLMFDSPVGLATPSPPVYSNVAELRCYVPMIPCDV